MPLVSVIMPVYNGEKYLAEAIESILAQSFADFELLVVDDASQDGSVEVIRSYENLDDRIRFFQHERNMGHGTTLNTGLAEATGAYIATMDCDDVSLPVRLEKQVNFLESHPGIGAVGTCARVVNHDLTATFFDFNVPRQHALITFNLFFGASFVEATVMVRREFPMSVQGYEPGRRYVTNLELNLRLLAKTPIRFANLPDNLMLYRQHEHSLSADREARKYVAPELEVRGRMLQHLWGEAPEGTLDRFYSLRKHKKLNWTDRRAANKDLRRLIEALIAHNLVDAVDRPLLLATMNRHLEQASPRLWQQFCHWRRHHFPRLFPDTFQLSQ
ncbi:MAG: glycosyltransferase family 2 protein [Chloroflexi bacterium]|nr:glycosyltransferase family 2 protein [Chloroflexota bacterium]